MGNKTNVYDFFDLVLSGELGELDIDNYIQNTTDNFNIKKLKKLLYDIEYCLFCESEEKNSEFTSNDIKSALSKLIKQNKEIPHIIIPPLKNKKGEIISKESKILNLEKIFYPYEFFTIHRLIGQIKHHIKENEKATPPQETEMKIEQETENNVLISTIEDWLFEFKEKMTAIDYNTLVSALRQYFETGNFPAINKQIKVGKVNKKLFGWALNQIYRTEKTNSLPKEYLLFAKQNISLFTDVDFNETDILNSNLYKYFTTKTK